MAKARYVIQWDEQPFHLSKVLCSLVESQMLVDLTVNCNSYTIKVHKCVLAANSTYFRDHLQKDMSIDRVVINGIKHIVLKALIEFMYCGETSIPEENINELIAAAKYFCVRGIPCIIPHKLGDTTDRITESNLINKPPIFFSKNDKKYSFKEKDPNYALFDNLGRRKHSHIKVTDEAHVALAKEEAASRFALEMLKKDINNTSNVFVIDETCTEATVETNLTAQYENSNNVMQIQEYVIQNDIKSDTSELNERSNIGMNNLMPKPKQSPNEDRINEISNVPMLYKPNDASYVNVNVSNQILESLQNSHAITYHVMPEDENVDFQQYICNNFGQYTVQLETAQQDSSYEIVNQTDSKKPLTFTQLVADTVNSDYDSTYAETSTSFDTMLTKNKENVQYVAGNAVKMPDEIFASNYNDSFGAELIEARNKEMLIENIITPKKKRGRPPKRKLYENNSADTKPFIQMNESSDTVESLDNTEEDFTMGDDEKENESPIDQNMKDLETCKVSQDQNNCNVLNENRRQTRSSLKFHSLIFKS